MGSVRRHGCDHHDSTGVSQAAPPTRAWSVQNCRAACMGSVTSGPATPEDLEDPRWSQEERGSVTSF